MNSEQNQQEQDDIIFYYEQLKEQLLHEIKIEQDSKNQQLQKLSEISLLEDFEEDKAVFEIELFMQKIQQQTKSYFQDNIQKATHTSNMQSKEIQKFKEYVDDEIEKSEQFSQKFEEIQKQFLNIEKLAAVVKRIRKRCEAIAKIKNLKINQIYFIKY